MNEPFPSTPDYQTRGERREKQRNKKRYGMQVSGASVKVLATIVPKSKRRKRKKGKR